jgi:ATP-binding cassette, subfamily B, bacterial
MTTKSYSYLFKYIKLMFAIGKFGIFISFMFMICVTGISLVLPEIIKRIIDFGIVDKNVTLIISLCCIYILLVLASNGIDVLLENYYETLKLKVSTNLKMKLLNQLAQANGKYISNLETGNILRILDNDIFQVESFGIDLILQLVMNGATAIIVFFILLKSNVLLLMIIIVIQISMFGIQIIMSKRITNNITKVRETAGEQSNLQEQFVSNIKNVILTNVGQYFQNLVCKKQADFVAQSKKVNILISLNSKVASALNSLGTILTYLIGGIMIVSNKMSFGELVAFLQYTSLLIAPCMFFVSSNIKIRQTNVSLKKIYNEIDSVGMVVDKEGCVECSDIINEIHFDSVDFTYTDKKILNDVSLTLKRNEVTAIIGESGCGKSTLLSLLYRLWDPDKGTILINNKNIAEFKVSSLRKKICIVSQESLIFNDSIKENIRMANNQVCEDTINVICNTVGLSSLIATNSNEADNLNIGERGSKLSGGQRQRVAIARTLLNECDVLILDEPTSSLDNISQKELIENITPFFKDKIVIMIAHRMSSVKSADTIIVMKDGEIIETGNHKLLMDYKGVYHTMTSLN